MKNKMQLAFHCLSIINELIKKKATAIDNYNEKR